MSLGIDFFCDLFCLVTKYSVVLTGDVFAGVGPIALAAARIVKRVYANDLNPHAVEFMEQNSVVNKLEKRIEVSTNSKHLVHTLNHL